MTNNNTHTIDSTDINPFRKLLGAMVGYGIFGIVLLLANGAIFTGICYHRLLKSRKEYVLPALLALNDSMEGLMLAFAGFGRIWLITTNGAQKFVTRLYCLCMPWIPLSVLALHVKDFILLMITVDRLVAVSWPLYHYGLTHSYSKKMVLLSLSPAIFGILYVVAIVPGDQEPVMAICIASLMYRPLYNSILLYIRLTVSTLSVVLYVPVMIMYQRHNDVMLTTQSVDTKTYMAAQRRFTITLGLSTLLTSILYVGPGLARVTLPLWGETTTTWIAIMLPYLNLVELLNKLANIFLYSLRHKNLRLGLKLLFQGKQLTQNVINAVPNNVVLPLTPMAHPHHVAPVDVEVPYDLQQPITAGNHHMINIQGRERFARNIGMKKVMLPKRLNF